MAIVGYSPWQDAASYGAGLGSTLSEALLQMPRMRAEQAMEQARFKNEMEMAPYHKLITEKYFLFGIKGLTLLCRCKLFKGNKK